jgi:muramoyltetrapeptide carboxypeptidase LdcA involved in peptidoglycan recycling
MTPNSGYEILQGNGKVSGYTMVVCTGPSQLMKGTSLFPKEEDWENSIIFIEGILPYGLELAGIHTLRSFAATGMFRKANGVVIAKPGGKFEESKRIILKVIRDEEGLKDLPILFNFDCGHTAPMTIMPFGVMGEIDCDYKSFRILESGVI